MFLTLLLFGSIAFVGDAVRATPDTTQTDTLRDYYRDYHRMSEHELRAELTLIWYTTVGGAYYNLKERISDDCAKTSTAAADLWQQLSTVEDTTPLIANALKDAAIDARTTRTLVHPMELICQHLEKRLREDANVYAKFVRLKQTPATNASHGRPSAPHSHGKTVDVTGHSYEYMNAFNVFWLGIPRVGQMVTHATFVNHVSLSNCSDAHKLGKSIIELSKVERLQRPVQNLYEKVRQQVIESVLETIIGEPGSKPVPVFKLVHNTIMAKLEREFDTDTQLAEEFVKMKKLNSENYTDAEL